MPLKLKQFDDGWIVDNAHFQLCFAKSVLGIRAFAYSKGGNYHNAVNHYASGILYLPRIDVPVLDGGPLAPHHGGNIQVLHASHTVIQILVSGYLSNPTQGASLNDFPFASQYTIYEDGDVYIKTTIVNVSGSMVQQVTEEHILDLVDDDDITLERDTAPNLWFAGFYSNNTGDAPSDLSHDGVLIQHADDFTAYVTYTDDNRNAVGLAKNAETWVDQSIHESYFLLHLSANGSPCDIEDASDFQEIGDEKGYDYRNSDPLDGGPNEGD